MTLRVAPEKRRIQVSVVDNGVGIPADEIALVVQRFYRTRDARTRSSGSGLGLAIVNEVCARHDTHLSITSDAAGTRIAFELPLA